MQPEAPYADSDEQYYQSIPAHNQKSDRADLIDKIDPKMIVELIRHRLLGETWDGVQWIKVPALKEFALTERGAWELANLMLGPSSINTTISRYSEDLIKGRFKRTIKAAMIMISAYWREYGIKNAAQFYFVDDLIRSNTLAVLNQAGDGSIQELLKGTVQEQRQVFTERKESGRLKKLLGLG